MDSGPYWGIPGLGFRVFPAGSFAGRLSYWFVQGIVFLAHKCDSGFGGSFVVPECWNMLVCHHACHTIVPSTYD